MRILADANIVRMAVQALRDAGHDVEYVAEQASDPGDAALLERAFESRRVLVSKDQDFGILAFRDSAPHAGVVLIDDFGDVSTEVDVLVETFGVHETELAARAFIRVDSSGARIVNQ